MKATHLIRIHKVFTRALAVLSQHSQGAGPEPILQDGFQRYELPFMLYNMPAKDRAAMAQGLPAVMIDQLIPIAWKAVWTPMQPFSLE